MVDVVLISKTILQMHIIVNRCHNIILGNMLRNQLGNLSFDCFFQLFSVCVLSKKLLQHRIIYRLFDSHLMEIEIYIFAQVNHTVGEHFDITFLTFYPDKRNAGILQFYCKIMIDLGICFCDDLTSRSIYYIFSQHLTAYTVLQMKLLIEFITANLCQIISLRIEEHTCDQRLCALYCQRLTRSDLFVQLKQTLLIALRSVFC